MQLACCIHSAHHYAARHTQLTAYVHAADGLVAAVEATLNDKVWRHHELPTPTLNLRVEQGKVSCGRGSRCTVVSGPGQCNDASLLKNITDQLLVDSSAGRQPNSPQGLLPATAALDDTSLPSTKW
jgi:hypothetical protein